MLQASDEIKARVAELIYSEKQGTLSAEETWELEHLMRSAKAQAKIDESSD